MTIDMALAFSKWNEKQPEIRGDHAHVVAMADQQRAAFRAGAEWAARETIRVNSMMSCCCCRRIEEWMQEQGMVVDEDAIGWSRTACSLLLWEVGPVTSGMPGDAKIVNISEDWSG